MPKFTKVWEGQYRQKFGNGEFASYTDTFLGHDCLNQAAKALNECLWKENIDERPCSGVEIVSLKSVAEITRKL